MNICADHWRCSVSSWRIWPCPAEVFGWLWWEKDQALVRSLKSFESQLCGQAYVKRKSCTLMLFDLKVLLKLACDIRGFTGLHHLWVFVFPCPAELKQWMHLWFLLIMQWYFRNMCCEYQNRSSWFSWNCCLESALCSLNACNISKG